MKPEKKPAVRKTAPEKTEKPAAKAKPPKKNLKVPPILLEGDAPSPAGIGGPGQRYSLGPVPSQTAKVADLGELPEAYGTQKLLLTARDPHWLYAHWDLTREQLKGYNAQSVDHHLVLRVYQDSFEKPVVSEIHVHPESKNWFVPVAHDGSKYLAEIGFYKEAKKWVSIAKSGATLTPPDNLSDDTSVRFATIPVDVPFEQLLSLVKMVVRENVPLIEALQQLRASGFKDLPEIAAITSAKWTPAQERALAAVVTMDSVRRVWMGSLEITELIRRQLIEEISSQSASQLSLPSSPFGALGSISSAFGGVPKRKSFWFNVNAELIIYGATEPDASVTIGGRAIKLRPDGTFSFRFILPDGNYDLPAQAVSAEGDDARQASLSFSRSTDYRGEVGAHPQDPKMKPPFVANVA